MPRFLSFFLVLIILIPGMFAEEYSNSSLFIPVQSPLDTHSILVKYNTSVTNEIQAINDINSGIHAETVRDYSVFGLPGLYLVQIPEEMSTVDSLSYYQNQTGVEYVEPDYPIRFLKLPNDPDFQNQWGLFNAGQIYKTNISPGVPGADLKASDAWDISVGSKQVVIAVLDTGIDYYHPDLSGNLWTDPVTGAHGYNVLDGTYNPLDLWGHGTHCAGIIGSVGNNSIGGSGVCWNVSIMGVKIGQMWEGRMSDSIAGILWAGQHDADIISCSWGDSANSRALEEAISMTPALFVCAAGNNGRDLDKEPYYPAAYDLPNVLSVAATDPHDSLADFSNYGAHTVDVGSPGVDIYSTWKGQSGAEPFWYDPLTSLANWSYQGDWHLDTIHYNSSPSSAAINISFKDPVLIPYFVLNKPVNLSGHTRPVFQFGYDGIFWPSALKMSVDACVDNEFNWKRIGYWSAGFFSFDTISCDIPEEFIGKSILVRFGIQQQYPPEGENKTIPVRIDDIRFSEKTDAYTPSYRYLDGTSMAAPGVSGVAGLVKSVQPNLSPGELRNILIKTVDPKPSLQGKTLSGGRVNASAAARYSNTTSSGEIPLEPGWNIVSVPKMLISDNNTAAIFQEVPSGGHALFTFDPAIGYIRLNQSDIIRPFNGYWIYSQSLMNVSVKFSQEPLSSRNLEKGWSLFGPGSLVQVPAKQALSGLGKTWTMVTGYNASMQQYEDPILNGGTGNYRDERMLIPSHGYWMLMNGTGTVP